MCVEFQRNAHIVGGQQCPALKGAFNPLGRTTLCPEPSFCPVEIILVEYLESHDFNRSGWSDFLEDHAVMTALFHGAQIDVGVVLVRYLKSEQIGIESP